MKLYDELVARTRKWTWEAFKDDKTVRSMIKNKLHEIRNKDKGLCERIFKRFARILLKRQINEMNAKKPMNEREVSTLMALHASCDSSLAERMRVRIFETEDEFQAYLKSNGYVYVEGGAAQ